MTTISCKITDKLAAELESLSRRERRSKSTLVREALEQKIKTRRGPRVTSAWELVKHLSGTLSGAPADLATNPEHMSGFGG